MSGEVDSFNAHYPAFIALTACQISWKFGTIFKVKAKKKLFAYFFCAPSVFVDRCNA